MQKSAIWCVILMIVAGGCGRESGTAPAPQEKTPETSTASSPQEKTPAAAKEISFDLAPGVKLEMVLIPAGEFLMGSPDSDKDADEKKPQHGDRVTKPLYPCKYSEKPQHLVRITKPFYLGKYLVTKEQWEAVTGEDPSFAEMVRSPFRTGDKNPVVLKGCDDCQPFLKKLNAKFVQCKGRFTLPTEAQWEYACRAGSTTRYYFGDDESLLAEYAWYSGHSDGIKTHPVGEKKPNVWGLYDMLGNVDEVCQDWYDSDYYGKSPTDDPAGPPRGLYRVGRGGSWGTNAKGCRSASRFIIPDSTWFVELLGFRVALASADK
jgi:formylglycine-generating enzyme required for sulfatase activity